MMKHVSQNGESEYLRTKVSSRGQSTTVMQPLNLLVIR